MFAADPYFQIRSSGPAFGHRNLHQLSYAFPIQRFKRILGIDFHFDVRNQKAAGVVSANTQGCLGEVIGPKAEELGSLGDLIGYECASWDLNHGSDQVVELHFLSFDDLFCH